MYMTLMVIVRPLGLSGGSSVEVGEPGISMGESSAMAVSSASRSPKVDEVPNIQAGQDGSKDPSRDGSLSQKIGRMVEEAEKVVRGDGTELEDSDEPRNPKKRVMDTSKEGMSAGDVIDELEQDEQWQDAREHIETEQARDEL